MSDWEYHWWYLMSRYKTTVFGLRVCEGGIDWAEISLVVENEVTRTPEMLRRYKRCDFDSVAILFVFPTRAKHTERLHRHRWKVKKSSLPDMEWGICLHQILIAYAAIKLWRSTRDEVTTRWLNLSVEHSCLGLHLQVSLWSLGRCFFIPSLYPP